jgi:hypothetical protein
VAGAEVILDEARVSTPDANLVDVVVVRVQDRRRLPLRWRATLTNGEELG